MNDNSKSLFFLIVSFGCFWLVLDEYYGQKYLSKLVDGLGIGGSSLSNGIIDASESVSDKVSESLGGKTFEELTQNAQNFLDANEKYKSLPKTLRTYILTGMGDSAPSAFGQKSMISYIQNNKAWSDADKKTAENALQEWWNSLSSNKHTSSSGNTAGGTGGSF